LRHLIDKPCAGFLKGARTLRQGFLPQAPRAAFIGKTPDVREIRLGVSGLWTGPLTVDGALAWLMTCEGERYRRYSKHEDRQNESVKFTLERRTMF